MNGFEYFPCGAQLLNRKGKQGGGAQKNLQNKKKQAEVDGNRIEK